jgi:hypothetical protein
MGALRTPVGKLTAASCPLRIVIRKLEGVMGALRIAVGKLTAASCPLRIVIRRLLDALSS